jgi:mannose-6-phosphate isomerase-like protein (cupin superfamily)
MPTPFVAGPDDLEPFRPLPGDQGTGSYRIPIDLRSGIRNLVQRVFRFEPGQRATMTTGRNEDVLFVVSGEGEATVGERAIALEPGLGVLVPPGTPYTLGGDDLVVVSAIAPPPWGDPVASPEAVPVDPDRLTLHERDQEVLPAGDDRDFKLMVDPRIGCRYLTQFLGSIRRSRAPFHVHTYEECIYVLAGEGIVHIGDSQTPIPAGSSVYLPPGTPHCLENAGIDTLQLLGVFAPAGSPADKVEHMQTLALDAKLRQRPTA